MAKERFVETYSQGVTNVRKIIVDTETGVNYLLIRKISNFDRVDSHRATAKKCCRPFP